MKNVLIFVTNWRAVVTQLRVLSNISNITIHIAFEKITLSHRIRFKKYIKKKFVYEYESLDKIIPFINNLHKKIGSFIIIPNGEELLREIGKNKDLFLKKNIELPMPNIDVYKNISNKKSFVEICIKYNIPVPQNIEVADKIYKQKFVVKPKCLSSEKNVLKIPLLIENQKSFEKFKKLNLDLTKHFIQNYVYGQSYYYCAHYRAGEKKTFFVQKNLIQQPGGKSIIKAKPSYLPDEMIRKIDNMMKDMKWEGVMMFELKKDVKTELFYAIEVNPRFWGPLQLAVDNNINFVKSIIDINYKNFRQENKIGYLWKTGFFHGKLVKFQTGNNFQKFDDNNTEIEFKDVWKRSDTMLYYYAEYLIIFIRELRDFVKKFFNKSRRTK